MTLPLIATALDILFPRKCVGCKKDQTLLCDTCTKRIRRELHTPDNWTYAYFSMASEVQRTLWIWKDVGQIALR